MAGRDVDYLPRFNAGAEVGAVTKKLKVPISSGTPAGAAQGWVWVDTADVISLAYHDGTDPHLLPITGATTEAIQDIVGPWLNADLGDVSGAYNDAGDLLAITLDARSVTYAKMQAMATARLLGRVTAASGDVEELTLAQVKTFLSLSSVDLSDFNTAVRALISVTDDATLNLTYAAGVISGVVLDSPTVGGQTPAALQTTIVDAIVNGAGAAWDTLLEIKAFIEAGDSTAASLATTVAGKARFKVGVVPNGATPQTINHAMALTDLRDYIIEIKNAGGDIIDYQIAPVDVNNVSIIDESGTAIPAGLRYMMVCST